VLQVQTASSIGAVFKFQTLEATMDAAIKENKAELDEGQASHRPSIKRHVSIPGQAYMLSTTTLFRRPIFCDFEAASMVASVHSMKWVWRDSRVLAWVLMPDHWQGLIVLGQNDELCKLVGRFKKASAQNSANRYKTDGWLWGNGFREQALKEDVVLRDAGRHLITHPIRAGLVNEVGMYPYWNAVWLDRGSDDPPWPGSRR
jgi:putative transposase